MNTEGRVTMQNNIKKNVKSVPGTSFGLAKDPAGAERAREWELQVSAKLGTKYSGARSCTEA